MAASAAFSTAGDLTVFGMRGAVVPRIITVSMSVVSAAITFALVFWVIWPLIEEAVQDTRRRWLWGVLLYVATPLVLSAGVRQLVLRLTRVLM